MSQHLIDLINITKYFGKHKVLDNINLYIRRNEFLTLLGPSGCGKTTTLRIMGGFEEPTSGDLLFENKSILNVPPNKRNLNTVFQKYALFPNMNVEENIAFGLKIKKTEDKIIKQKVGKMLESVNLAGFEKRSVKTLSGGQQQRVAIARALVNEPEVLLLDEPLGALDLKLRKEMQTELKNMQRELGITFIYVTHDQEEALTMSDTIVVMNQGSIMQTGTPQEIYNKPQNAFVADFIGESNIFDGIMLEDYKVKFGNTVFDCNATGFAKNEAVDVVVRPEDTRIVSHDDGTLKGVIKNVIFKGVYYEILIESGSFRWLVHSTNEIPKGTEVEMCIDPNFIQIMKKDA